MPRKKKKRTHQLDKNDLDHGQYSAVASAPATEIQKHSFLFLQIIEKIINP